LGIEASEMGKKLVVTISYLAAKTAAYILKKIGFLYICSSFDFHFFYSSSSTIVDIFQPLTRAQRLLFLFANSLSILYLLPSIVHG